MELNRAEVSGADQTHPPSGRPESELSLGGRMGQLGLNRAEVGGETWQYGPEGSSGGKIIKFHLKLPEITRQNSSS